MPPPFDSKKQLFTIVDSDGSTTRDLSAFITSVDGLPGDNELQDTSKVGDSGHTFTRTLWNAPFTLEGYYDNTATSGPAVVLDNLQAMDTATTFVWAPTGNASGETPPNRQYTGSVFLKGHNNTARVGSVISFRASMQSNGKISVADSSG